MKYELKGCENCKYAHLGNLVEPCVNCIKSDHFEEAKQEIAIANTDNVNHPQHYNQGKFECIDVIEEITRPCNKFEAYLVGTILKYLWRFKFKNGLEDLKKSRWYLDKLISKMEGEGNDI